MLSGVADEAFSSVSAGKLKRWLLSKDVDVSGCIEKSDLIKRAKNLRLPFHELLVPPAQKLKRQGPSSDGKSGFVFLGDNIPVRNKVGAVLYSLKLCAWTGLKGNARSPKPSPSSNQLSQNNKRPPSGRFDRGATSSSAGAKRTRPFHSTSPWDSRPQPAPRQGQGPKQTVPHPSNLRSSGPQQLPVHHHRRQDPSRDGRKGNDRSKQSQVELKRCVLGGTLFNPGCQGALDPLVALPSEFGGLSSYVNSFKPLLLEEARASLRRNWEEECENGRLYPAQLQRVEERKGEGGPGRGGEGGALMLEVTFEFDRSKLGKKKIMAQDVLVFVDRQPPRGKVSATEWLSGELLKRAEDDESLRQAAALGEGNARAAQLKHVQCFAGLVKDFRGGRPGDSQASVAVEVFPLCHMHQRCGRECERHVNKASLMARLAARHTWRFSLCGNALVTVKREFGALSNLSSFPLHQSILKPRRMIDGVPGREQLPPECSGQAFQKFLGDHFNEKQYEAVRTAASRMALADNSARTPGKQLGSKAFTLVHGPPGTGKTHTIHGILNAVHLVGFQRYYKRITEAVKQNWNIVTPGAGASSMSRREAQTLCDYLLTPPHLKQKQKQRVLENLAPKPRILVCAPSNAAVDELCKRVVQLQFQDMNMNKYRPDVVRVSAGGASLNQVISQVSARDQATGFLRGLSRRDWDFRNRQSQNEIQRYNRLINHFVSEIKKKRFRLDPKKNPTRADFEDLEANLGELVRLHEARDKHINHLERLALCESIVDMRSRGQLQGAGHDREELVEKKARENLENTFLRDAEIVFSTLSSSANRSFTSLDLKFQVVLIDEAAQASEVECLQPLQYGARHCVLVGDPQQLPATVLSELAARCSYGRSMMERFANDGVYAIQLNEQFRMLPDIREFPSRYFYGDSLRDAQNVVQLSRSKLATIYKYLQSKGEGPPLDGKDDLELLDRAYTVFDVKGTNVRSPQGSLANPEEVSVVLGLYDYLMGKMSPKGEGEEGKPSVSASWARCSVGVITPYRHQRNLLKEAFMKEYGHVGEGSRACNVRIDTIDSFQGKERDVVILSCVRSSSASSSSQKKREGDLLGFVSDIRRMNVAITRSKMMLWIVGDMETLQTDEAWKALIEDAERRALVRRDAAELIKNWSKEEGEL